MGGFVFDFEHVVYHAQVLRVHLRGIPLEPGAPVAVPEVSEDVKHVSFGGSRETDHEHPEVRPERKRRGTRTRKALEGRDHPGGLSAA